MSEQNNLLDLKPLIHYHLLICIQNTLFLIDMTKFLKLDDLMDFYRGLNPFSFVSSQ